jgi:hypothetical protein
LLQIGSHQLEQVFTIFAMVAGLGAKEFRKLQRKNAIEILEVGADGQRR